MFFSIKDTHDESHCYVCQGIANSTIDSHMCEWNKTIFISDIELDGDDYSTGWIVYPNGEVEIIL